MERTKNRSRTNEAMSQPGLHGGLGHLLQAFRYASDLSRSVWDFAIEIPSLRKEGLTRSDLRWLVCQRYVEHACETTVASEHARTFRPEGELSFTARSCFVLTAEGARYAHRVLGESSAAAAVNGSSTATNGKAASAAVLIPKWDHHRHELRVGDRLVKIFKLPSPNQETILMAFEEEGWPPQIDDPLPPHPDLDPKRRLHDTIKSLNRNQKSSLLRFIGNGTGQGIRWELAATGEANGLKNGLANGA